MMPHLDPMRMAPKSLRSLPGSANTIAASPLGTSLLERVKIRASRISGCADGLHLQSRNARAGGETGERIAHFGAWNRIAIGFRSVANAGGCDGARH